MNQILIYYNNITKNKNNEKNNKKLYRISCSWYWKYWIINVWCNFRFYELKETLIENVLSEDNRPSNKDEWRLNLHNLMKYFKENE